MRHEGVGAWDGGRGFGERCTAIQKQQARTVGGRGHGNMPLSSSVVDGIAG